MVSQSGPVNKRVSGLLDFYSSPVDRNETCDELDGDSDDSDHPDGDGYSRKSRFSTYTRRTIQSMVGVSSVHYKKFGSHKKLEKEQQRIKDNPFVIHPYSNFRYIWDITTLVILLM